MQFDRVLEQPFYVKKFFMVMQGIHIQIWIFLFSIAKRLRYILLVLF